MDLAEAHGACLACRTSWPARDQSTNLGTGQGYSVLDMVAAFTKASSRAVPYRILLRRASDVAACYGRSWESSAGVGLADAARSFGYVRERLEIPEL
jgi:UDP-glucose 4-epimerase